MSERSDNDARRLCPDGGACHHGCEVGCYRVGACEPLSGVYEGDRWPESVKDAERIFAELRRWLAAECETTMDEHRNFHSDYDEGRFDALEAVEARLDELAGAASAERIFAELRRWLAAECETTMDEHRNFHSDYDEGRFDALEAVEARLDELAGAASAEAVARLETGQSESGAG